MTRKIATTVVLVAALMILALPALGHVTVRSDNPEPGGFAVYTVRVPNESETGSTIRIEVQMPEGLEASRYQPVPGWDMSIENGVLLIEGGTIGPGQFEEFRFQARNPEQPGDISFPAVQTYDDGEVVNWSGAPESEAPASVVEIAATTTGGTDGQTAMGTTDTLTIAALILGAIGVILGGVAVLRPRTA
jgi:uncharacterized protein YcnI